jgi:hypothetical protein
MGEGMRKLLCFLLGHDVMATTARRRVCLRCGQREALRRYGEVLAWEEMTDKPLGGTAA